MHKLFSNQSATLTDILPSHPRPDSNRVLDASLLDFDLPTVIERIKQEPAWIYGKHNAITLTTVYGVLNNKAHRDKLIVFVNNYNATNPVITGNTSMTATRFNKLYVAAQNQTTANAKVSYLTNVFTNTTNYFTSNQASQLIQIVSAESNRLQLAKISYRSITDPVNFSQVYNLLSTQASRDELSAFINNNSTSNSNVAMTDANFKILYQTIQGQFFPNEKMNSLVNTFNNTTNYFTASQVKQLIQLVSFESNRLQLAKLSYRTVTDRSNFEQVYTLLNTQASRDELELYVKAYKD